MEKMLSRLVRQLEAIDEASLMNLWTKYATITTRFEPTKQWEEAALIFSLIQAKRWKNQLFNYHWSKQSKPSQNTQKPVKISGLPVFTLEPDQENDLNNQNKKTQNCRVLEFKPEKN